MTSTVCHRFVQNAWKKERCSNCFKSKEEHISLKREAPVSRRPLASSRSRGIMKTTPTTPARRKRTVSFKTDLTEVIGFGGEDWEEEEDDDDSPNETSEDDSPSSTDEDKDLENITKTNTEHNANIIATATDRRRTFTQLMLGQPQKDPEGKKQTLVVSVTPFGADDTDKAPPRRPNKSVSHIPIAKNKELLAEARPKVVLTSYSKNRDSPDLINNVNNKDKDKKEAKEVKTEQEVAKQPPNETNSVRFTKIEQTTVKPAQILKKETVELSDKSTEAKTVENSDKIINKPNSVVNNNSEINQDKFQKEVNCEEVVETINEKSVLRNTDGVSVTTGEKTVEKIPVLEIVKCEQIVKSELKVQLSPTSKSPPIIIPPPSAPDKPITPTLPPSDNISSDDSADSLGPAPAESREQAGEPDGRADPDVSCEPPALPRSPPPPLVAPPPRSSFLHGSPRSPGGQMPAQLQVQADKPKVPSKPEKVPQIIRTSSIDLPPLPIQQQQTQTPNKRRAPNPPPCTIEDPLLLDPIPIEQIPESPLIRFYQPEIPSPVEEPPLPPPGPETTPRKTSNPVSMSTDNLVISEEKRKDKTKSRFSLKKFLRVGGSGSKNLEKSKVEEVKEKGQPMPKPRLVIVHPLELNGSAVEVVTPPSNGPEDGLTFATSVKEILPPAPPPRNLSEKRSEEPKPPPKSEELLRKQRQQPPSPSKTSTTDNVYANLGEVRSGLAPCKPQRTASMREREALLEQQQIRRKTTQPQENVYERINPPRRHSDESNSGSKEQRFKPGSFSGSEPDLELYSPCGSYYGSECEISEGGCSRPCRLRSRKGRSIVHRNLEDNYGAVVVANHEALAQVLEHLHQQTSIQPALRGLQSAPVLRWSDFSVVDAFPGMVVGRRAFYHALWGAHHVTLAVCKDQGSMHKHPVGLGAFSLAPVTEFSDLVAGKFVPGGNDQEAVVQASVAVLPWMQVDTIQSFGSTKTSTQTTETNRDACFILLQFVNSLKNLQAQGIEEVPLSLSNFILCHDVDRDTHHRLCLLQGFSEEVCRTDEKEKLGSLCQSATAALEELFPTTKLAILIKTLLKKESAVSLSQVKSILEFSLWGPSDVASGVPIKERELALQRWLDLERATVLHGLVGTRVQLSVLEECHLLFLVRSSAKTMCEASLLLETNGVS